MRHVRAALAFAAVTCLFGALSAPAFAKEKLVFGEFVASVAGKTISPTSTVPLVENKEDEAEVTGMQLGPYKFGRANKEKGDFEYEHPCLKAPKVTGKVAEERSSELLTEVSFKQCVSSVKGSVSPFKAVSFKLGIDFHSNESAEIGKTASDGIEIAEGVSVVFKGTDPCVVEIPAQFVPGKASEKEEKFYEAAEYSTEHEAPVENWEKSKKVKEEYPGDFKNRLEIETTEKFKGIVTYVDTAGASEKKGCLVPKGEENTKYITEKEIEGKPNPHYHWTEFRNGRIEMDMEGLEIKGGELGFEPPA